MKKQKQENFLEKIPCINNDIEYTKNDEGKITLVVKNKGFFNFLAQKLFFAPDKSYIHLDELGSFCVLCTDGTKNIIQIGELVKSEFGDKAEPLYQRLSQFYKIMASYNFVVFK